MARRLAAAYKIKKRAHAYYQRRHRRLATAEARTLAWTSNQLQAMKPEQLAKITAHAEVASIQSLLQLQQVDVVSCINLLRKMFARTNYLQELMIVKAFSNSIEISKAVEYMNSL